MIACFIGAFIKQPAQTEQLKTRSLLLIFETNPSAIRNNDYDNFDIVELIMSVVSTKGTLNKSFHREIRLKISSNKHCIRK